MSLENQVYQQVAEKALSGELISREEAYEILSSDNSDILALMHAAYTVRHKTFQNKVKLNMLINAKSGLCQENCGYCSQSRLSKADIEKYGMLSKQTILAGAKEAIGRGAGTYCIVTSGRGASNKEIDQVADAVREIKSQYEVKICACMGIIDEEKASRLKDAGVDRYNHNLNTSSDHHDNITTSHSYEDRVDTVKNAKTVGISPCSGIIVGMGESQDDLYDAAVALRELDADSIPVNFLNPIEGTPLEKQSEITPLYCLKALALFRFINPTKEIRMAGGREVNLGSLQPLGLYAANSIFVGDYLTTEGQEFSLDHKMIQEMGFEVDRAKKTLATSD